MFHFKIGQRVKFKDRFFKGIVPKEIAAYWGHEFVIINYLTDDGGEQIKDHLILECRTGSVQVQGAVHDDDVELVSEVIEPVTFSAIQTDPLLSYELMNAGISLTEGLSSRTPVHETAALAPGNITIDAAPVGIDWTDHIGSAFSAVGDGLSGAIELTGDALGSVGDTIGGIADGLGDVASGLGDILGSIDL